MTINLDEHDIPEGWKKLVLKCDAMLSHVDPNYEIGQVKEKFGELRYYFDSKYFFGPVSVEYEIMVAIVMYAQTASSNTCQICGRPGGIHKLNSQLYATLCELCYDGPEKI